MRGIVYVSEARMYFDSISLESLAADAASRNLEMGVSGYMYFEKDRFVQYIEGEESVVDALMDSIGRDRRHRIIRQIVEDGLNLRRFPDWHMRHLRRQELSQVKVESVLSDYLLHLDSTQHDVSSQRSRWERVVWGMVNRVSEVRGSLGFQ